MKIQNNRRKWQDATFVMIGVLTMAIIGIIWNALGSDPDHSFKFYAAVTTMTLIPIIISVPYYILTAKTIAIEEEGVAEYKKGELIKKLNFEDIVSIFISNSTISIRAAKNGYFLDSIKFSNNKKGFAEYELPFLVEIVKRCDYRVMPQQNELPDENWRTNKRMAMLIEAIKKSHETYVTK